MKSAKIVTPIPILPLKDMLWPFELSLRKMWPFSSKGCPPMIYIIIKVWSLNLTLTITLLQKSILKLKDCLPAVGFAQRGSKL